MLRSQPFIHLRLTDKGSESAQPQTHGAGQRDTVPAGDTNDQEGGSYSKSVRKCEMTGSGMA